MRARAHAYRREKDTYLATALLSGFLACSVEVYMTARVSKQVRSKGSGEDSVLVTCSSMEPACKVTAHTYSVILLTQQFIIGVCTTHSPSVPICNVCPNQVYQSDPQHHGSANTCSVVVDSQ